MADDPVIDIAKLEYAAQIADIAERAKIQASIADRALQSIMLANGGALVALFTFVGSKTGALTFDTFLLKASFACFAGGLGFALVAHLFAFLSQEQFMYSAGYEASRHARTIMAGRRDADKTKAKKAHKRGMQRYAFGLAVFGLSVVSFVSGSLVALLAVT